MKRSFACFVLLIAFSCSYSQTFTLNDTRFTVGSIYRTYSLQFDLGKASLLSHSFSVLDSFAHSMEQHPELVIEVGVHSDSRGSVLSNTNITQARAKSIREYLIKKNIPETHLKAVGYGESKLLVKDEQINGLKTIEEKEKNHQLNRRVEFKIIAIN